MILDVDAGNTRIKWRVNNAGSEIAAFAYEQDWRQALVQLSGQGCVRQIRVCSVRGKAFNCVLNDVCLRVFNVRPEFAVVEAEPFDVKPAYRDLSQLGLDRWLAMLAAYRRAPQGCIVVSLGTAITLDYVDRRGVHLGGYIVPGMTALASFLTDKTHAIDLHIGRVGGDLGPGSDTASCVKNGLSLMLSLFFEHALHHKTLLQVAGEPISTVFVAGGDSLMLTDLLSSWRFEKIHSAPELIFEGLDMAVVAHKV